MAWSWHCRSTMLPLSLNRNDRDGCLGLGDLTVLASRLPPAATIEATRATPPPSPPPGFDVDFWLSLIFVVSPTPFLGDYTCNIHDNITRTFFCLTVIVMRPS